MPTGSMAKILATLRYIFAALLILSTTWVFFGIWSLGRFDWDWRVNNAYEADYASRRFSWKKLMKNNSQCPIPILDPFNKELMEITSYHPDGKECHCNVTTYFRAGYNASEHPLLVRKPFFPHDELVCCWNNLEFTKKHPFVVANSVQLCRPIHENETEISLPSGTQFVTIKCENATNNLSFSTLNQTENWLDTVNPNITHKEVIFFVSPPNISNNKISSITKKDHLNIILFGLDGVSRMNFIRLMRSSYRFLTTKLNPIELHGYNSLASSTLINSLGFLTGLNLSTVRKTCWNTSKSYFDSCPWIWKNYSLKGYTTLFAEDYYSVFGYHLGGFQNQPTDYYLFPFGRWIDSFSKCIGNNTFLNFIEHYAKVATSKLKNVPSFQMYWCGRTYTSPADPFYIDESLKNLLTFWKDSGIFNKSAVILLSDHGYKQEPVLQNKQGILENQMPFAFLLFPKWFQMKYKEAYQNLVDNQWRLTTPFDLHEMLVDLLNLEDNLSKDKLQERVDSLPSHLAKGRATSKSLFLPIPKDRDCQTAGVDEMWCVCENYQRFDFDRPFGWIWYNIQPKDINLVLQMGNEIVKQMNEMMAPQRNSCMEYFLWKVLEVEKRNELIDGKTVYRLIIQVKPKAAIFNVILFHDEEADKFLMSREIFRLNQYVAICLSHYEFWHICACSNTAENEYQ
ncbi:unnamed protein product [Orchesella dallaii]|uniref:Uncharacterized protein n=1 Tax=Orchesella dallaii TaxID=48710 RepID=A0ABP1RZD1_9HEXA